MDQEREKVEFMEVLESIKLMNSYQIRRLIKEIEKMHSNETQLLTQEEYIFINEMFK